MPKTLKHAVGLIILVFMLQSCICYGYDMNAYFQNQRSTNTSNNAGLASGMNCSNVRLTSPRAGLPNSVVTVYWDALAGAVNYRVNLYSGAVRIGTWEAAAPATSLLADVSQAAVGGQNPFELELLAFDANGNYCRDYVAQNREAAPAQAAPVVVPSATPTCDEKPSAPYC